MAIGSIYLITNNFNAKVYVGLTTMTVNRRWIAHKSVANRTHHHSHSYLHHSMNKYGVSNFTVSTLEQVDVNLLSAAERKWIAYYGSTDHNKGYNLTDGGDRPVHTEESRRKLSQAKTGTTRSQEVKDNISKFHKGRKRSAETRARLSASMQARNKLHPRGPASEETKAKMRESHAKRRSKEKEDGTVHTYLSGEDHPMFGKSHSAETKERMCEFRRSPEGKAQQAEYKRLWWENNPEDAAEARRRMSDAQKARYSKSKAVKEVVLHSA